MFTLTNHQKSLEETRDFANTKANGLIDRSMSAEDFTEELQVNAQNVYKWATDKKSVLDVDDLQQIHKALCKDIQSGGGIPNPGAIQAYEESCETFRGDIATAKESFYQTPEIANKKLSDAIAKHLARCEAVPLFADHNSTVNRLACEAHMDMLFGKAQRPAMDQDNYNHAVQEAHNGNIETLSSRIWRNHEQALQAGKALWDWETQKVGPDYTTDWNAQDPSRQR